MKRFLLYPLASVLILAGEPAVGGPADPPHAAQLSTPSPLLAPIVRILTTITTPRGVPPRTGR